MRLSSAIAVAFALSACAQTAPAIAPAPPRAPSSAEEATAQDACGAAAFRRYIGRPASEIDRAGLPPRARVITPNMMITQDFSAQRLNIFVGADGVVGSLRCF